MRHLILTAAAAVSISLAGTAVAQTLSAEPGEWETSHTFTGTVQAQGMTMSMPGQTRTSTQCISPEEAAFKPEQLSGEGCSPENVQSSGNTISFDIVCNQNGASMKGTMQATASDDGRSVSGTMTMKGSQPGGGSLNMSGEFSGVRTGACS